MEDVLEQNEINSNEPRPGFLIVLCILSYVSMGYTFLVTLFQLLSGPASKDQMLAQKAVFMKSIRQFREVHADYLVDLFQKIIRMLEGVNQNFYFVQITTLLFAIIGVFGVVKMWKGAKLGFHVYIIYSILFIVQYYFILSPANIPSLIIITNIIVSGVFVFMYSRNLHWLK